MRIMIIPSEHALVGGKWKEYVGDALDSVNVEWQPMVWIIHN